MPQSTQGQVNRIKEVKERGVTKPREEGEAKGYGQHTSSPHLQHHHLALSTTSFSTSVCYRLLLFLSLIFFLYFCSYLMVAGLSKERRERGDLKGMEIERGRAAEVAEGERARGAVIGFRSTDRGVRCRTAIRFRNEKPGVPRSFCGVRVIRGDERGCGSLTGRGEGRGGTTPIEVKRRDCGRVRGDKNRWSRRKRERSNRIG